MQGINYRIWARYIWRTMWEGSRPDVLAEYHRKYRNWKVRYDLSDRLLRLPYRDSMFVDTELKLSPLVSNTSARLIIRIRWVMSPADALSVIWYVVSFR